MFLAKSSRGIEDQHQTTTQLKILHERCEIEIREKWIPFFCFEWLSQSSLALEEKKAFEEFFDQRCVSAASTMPSSTSWRSFAKLKIRKGRCFERLHQKYKDLIYQGQKTLPFSEMAKMIRIGRDFEFSSGHVEEKASKGGRLRNHRVHR